MEFMATTRLGFTREEFGHASIGECLRKLKIFKVVFNLEKFGEYDTEDHDQLDNLRDF